MTLGFEAAGFRNTGFVEFWKPAKETHALNFNHSRGIGDDIREIKSERFKAESPDLIIGGPPCQGFSRAGLRDPADPRNSLFMEFARAVKHAKPRVFVMENVPGIFGMETKDGEPVKRIIKKVFSDIGYSIVAKVVNFSNLGVPQMRRRAIFIGSRDNGIKNAFPLENREDLRTLADAIDDLPYSAEPKIQHEPTYTKNKDRLLKLANLKEGGMLYNFKASNRRLYWNRPAFTVTKGGDFVHPKYPRYLTVRERARLQTFPDSFRFRGSRTDACGQIGNAVPPLGAKRIAEKIMEVFEWE